MGRRFKLLIKFLDKKSTKIEEQEGKKGRRK